MNLRGSWHVRYQDGSEDWQHNAASPDFRPEHDEVPFSAIRWPEAAALTLESQDATTSLDIHPVDPAYQVSMRSRTFLTMDGVSVTAYLVLVSDAGAEVTDASVVSAFYWFPDGVTHQCDQFNCPEAAKYAAAFVHGQPGTIAQEHYRLQTEASLTLA